MSQAKLEFLEGKSVSSIIDWMLENMSESDIRGCLDAAGIQPSIGSRSMPSSSGAGSSTDPLPGMSSSAAALSRLADAGFSNQPISPRRSLGLKLARPGFEASSSTDPIPLLRVPSAERPEGPPPILRLPSAERPSSIIPEPLFARRLPSEEISSRTREFIRPGAATSFLPSRQPSGEIREGTYEPPEEMVDPYSTFIAPGIRRALLGGNDFGQLKNWSNINKYIKIHLEEQKKAREQTIIGNSINYIPLLIFDLEEKNGLEYLSYILFEPIKGNNSIIPSKITISGSKKIGMRNEELETILKTNLGTLTNIWVDFLYNIDSAEERYSVQEKIDSSFEAFLSEFPELSYSKENIQFLYSRENINYISISGSNNFGEDENMDKFDQQEFEQQEFDQQNYENEQQNYENEQQNYENEKPDYDQQEVEQQNYEKQDYEQQNYEKQDYEQQNYEKQEVEQPVIKKFGKVSNMNKEELREYVINKFGPEFYNQYDPQVYTTKTGFGNVRYVKRSVPLSEPLSFSKGYDYSIEEDNGNGPISFF